MAAGRAMYNDSRALQGRNLGGVRRGREKDFEQVDALHGGGGEVMRAKGR